MPGLVLIFLSFFFFPLAIKVFLEEGLVHTRQDKALCIKTPVLARTSKSYCITPSDMLSSGLFCISCEQYVNESIAELETCVMLPWGIFFSSSFHSFQITCLVQSVCSLHLVMLIR